MKNKDNYNLLVLKSFEFFINNPYDDIHLREFSRKLNISPNTSQRFLEMFLREGLLIEMRKANLRYFKANTESLLFKYIKKTYFIRKIIDSGLYDFLKKFNIVVLFGSVAKGLDHLKSDIDLVCIGQYKSIDLKNFEKKLKRQINAHLFSFAEWKIQKNENKAFYQDVISTGVNLIGEMPIIE